MAPQLPTAGHHPAASQPPGGPGRRRP